MLETSASVPRFSQNLPTADRVAVGVSFAAAFMLWVLGVAVAVFHAPDHCPAHGTSCPHHQRSK